MTEAELTRDCVKKLNKLPLCFAVKIVGGPVQRKGLPDIVGCFEGSFFGIEMKLPGKEHKVTPIQRSVLSAVELSGGRQGVATSYGQCLEIIGHGDAW